MRRVIYCSVGCAVLAFSATAHANLIFAFTEVGNDVIMTSSGTFDTTGLTVVGPWGWGSTGIEENGNHDIMGGTAFGPIDISFAFNAGTDFSQWASANGPWTSSDFSAVPTGTKSFTTYVFDNVQVPGLGVRAADMNGALWTTDQNWTFSNETFASLRMLVGTYAVSDSVTGETITFVIPEPGSMALIGLGLCLARLRRRRS